MKLPLMIACDFDGTVTRQDTLVEILNAFGDPAWRKIQDRVVLGELSVREGLQAEMGSVRASYERLKELLQTRIELEPAFFPFWKTMRRRGIPLVLLSGGFDFCVETLLLKEGLPYIATLANRLVRKNGAWAVEFPYPSQTCSACGHCKGDSLRTWEAQGYITVFVGNGVTDRCAASAAGLTFAKDELERWAKIQGIPFVPYQTFNDVQRELENRGWL